jgi:hypothetical protein
MAMPRPSATEWLPDVNACVATVTQAMSAIVEPTQVAAIEAIVRAAMQGFTERFTHYRLTLVENKLRRKSCRLLTERDRNQSLENALRASGTKSPSHKKKIPSSPLPLGSPA